MKGPNWAICAVHDAHAMPGILNFCGVICLNKLNPEEFQ
jgi:hypothetical protein